jgi:uncharacterized protein YdeI (YjbR/CyaY-like superfamily)
MPPFAVNTEAIHAFEDMAALETWFIENHGTATELWLKLHKKGSGLTSVSYAEALDVALCWGWIDGIKKAFDAQSFLQRFTPRGQRSIWSTRNQEHVARLSAAGRMRPEGQAEIDRAKADGRWERAYDGASRIEFPADLLAAIEAEPEALELFSRLSAQNRYALAFRMHQVKTAAGRAKKIAGFVEMLARGETIYPNGKASSGKNS